MEGKEHSWALKGYIDELFCNGAILEVLKLIESGVARIVLREYSDFKKLRRMSCRGLKDIKVKIVFSVTFAVRIVPRPFRLKELYFRSKKQVPIQINPRAAPGATSEDLRIFSSITTLRQYTNTVKLDVERAFCHNDALLEGVRAGYPEMAGGHGWDIGINKTEQELE